MWERLNDTLKIDEKALLLDENQRCASHKHCLSIGLHPGVNQLSDRLKGSTLRRFLERYTPAVTAAKSLFPQVYALLPDPSCVFVLTDAAGRIINLCSAPELITRCSEKGVLPGASLSEQACGTNAVALALHHQQPSIVKGRQHFFRLFHDWNCIAAPIFDAAGKLAGSIDFSTSREAEIDAKLPLVTMLAEKFSPVFTHRNPLGTVTGLHPGTPIFSPRQTRILAMVAKGLTSKEIGAELTISARTVETHLERMRTKACARTSAQLVALAFHPNQTSS